MKSLAVQTILDDPRPIVALTLPGDDSWWEVTEDTTKIVPYLEGANLWFAIFEGDILAIRVNGENVESVSYVRQG